MNEEQLFKFWLEFPGAGGGNVEPKHRKEFLTLLKEKYFECLKENKNLRDNYEQYKATAEPTIKELKTYNEKLLDSDIEKHNKIVSLEAQIEEAKEIIKEMLDIIANYKPFEDSFITKAEHFLKE